MSNYMACEEGLIRIRTGFRLSLSFFRHLSSLSFLPKKNMIFYEFDFGWSLITWSPSGGNA